MTQRKFINYEYWPFWLFYAPFVPYWLIKSAKAGSLNYFCKVNPGMRYGGFLDYSKFDVLMQVPDAYRPQSSFLKDKSELENLPELPFIVKPNESERGRNVEVIWNRTDWENYPVDKDLILQEYVTLPFEFGVFYARHPDDETGRVLSITGKEFLRWTSDGKTTLGEFVQTNIRAEKRKKYLERKFKVLWNQVLPAGQSVLLEPIGNHNRGTRFFDASNLKTGELEAKVDGISKNIKGFFYGRFDVKAESESEFAKGNFIVLEVNGANSEPTHIYDEKFNLFQAWNEAKKHFDIQHEISQANKDVEAEAGFYRSVLSRLF